MAAEEKMELGASTADRQWEEMVKRTVVAAVAVAVVHGRRQVLLLRKPTKRGW